MLAGKKDAASLLGVTSGLMGTIPFAAGSPLVAGGMAATVAGSAWLGWKAISRARETGVYKDKREGFVMPSDASPGNTYGNGGYRIGLTKDKNLPIDISDDVLMRHFAIIGQSGVGKTVLGESLLWQQTARGGGWLFIDAKLDRETRDHMAYMMKIMGREDDFYVLDSSDPSNSNTYNPLLRGSGDEVASRLMNLLPTAENNPGSDHYRQAANYALSVIISGLQAANMVYHFGDLSILLQSASALAELERRVEHSRGDEAASASRALRVFLDQYRVHGKEGPMIDVKRLKETFGGMAGRIATFAQGDFGRVMNHNNPEIDLPDILKNNKCVYIMLPTMAKDNAALNLGKMIVSDLRSAVAEVQDLPKYKRPNPPFMAFLDEMGSYVLYGVKTLFEQARSAQISMIPGFQAFANLSVVTDDFAEIVIQNTWSKALFKFGSRDAEEAAEILGKVNKYSRSLTAGDSFGGSSPIAKMTPQQQISDGTTFGSNYRKGEEFRVSPDRLRAFGKGECCLQSGARLFHLGIPMVVYPADIPPFVAVRRNLKIERNKEHAPFSSNYSEYLTISQQRIQDSEAKKEAEKMAKENKLINDRLVKPGDEGTET